MQLGGQCIFDLAFDLFVKGLHTHSTHVFHVILQCTNKQREIPIRYSMVQILKYLIYVLLELFLHKFPIIQVCNYGHFGFRLD